jgi:CheY-like chemotaxis protein
VRCGCEQGSRPCVVVLSSDRSLVAFVRAVVAEAHISVCGSQQWETVDDRVLDRRPTLFVLDLSMGQQDRCWATLERLASDPQLRSIPVVVCATVGWLLDGHADALARKGVHVWREPFDPAELLTTVGATIQAPTVVDTALAGPDERQGALAEAARPKSPNEVLSLPARRRTRRLTARVRSPRG